MDERLEQNKRTATVYDLMFNQSRPREAVEKYVGARYVEHWDVLQRVPAEAANPNTMF